MHRPVGSKNVVLLGIGHTHASLIKSYAMSPISKVNLIGISNFPVATYSGMLPGVLAGQYDRDQMEINLPRLASAAKIPLILDPVTNIDEVQRKIHFEDRATLSYDLLSVATGSVSKPPETRPGTEPLGDALVMIKPMQTFLDRLHNRIRQLKELRNSSDEKLQISVVGGGLGSVEVALCIEPTLIRHGLEKDEYQITLISGSNQPPHDCNSGVIKRVEKTFKNRGIQVITSNRADEVGSGKIFLENGSEITTDLCLFIGSTTAAPINSLLNVAKDDNGFIITDDYLRSTDRPEIWAAGDAGAMKNHSLSKAGVFAVRQGPIIWENLKRWSNRLPLTPYQPQKDFLKLINTGDGRAIGQWKQLSFQGKWVWGWKNRIDTRFIEMYQNPPSMNAMMETKDSTEDTQQMRCLGCGGKVGSAALREVLQGLVGEFGKSGEFSPIPENSDSDDVSITMIPSNSKAAVTSVDTLPTPIDDPWLSGRIAVLHSLSDLWCSGVRPHHIHTSVEVPYGKPKGQQDILWQTMHGICHELKKNHVLLSGGHSMEGPRLTVSITATGFTEQQSIPKPKQGFQKGDAIILTKMLGTGIVLAAAMQGKGHFQSILQAQASMLKPNQIALPLAQNFEIHSMTDVTGFGLIGHLTEMLADGALAASLDAESICKSQIPHTESLVQQGVHSTMRENNELFLVGTAFEDTWKQYLNSGSKKTLDKKRMALELMLDPQTSGGILLSCPMREAEKVVAFVDQQGQEARVIGQIHENLAGSSVQWQV